MTTAPVPVPRLTSPATLTTHQFQDLAAIPPELEWFANLTNANTRRAYR
jgi:integrase/recombinase XerD